MKIEISGFDWDNVLLGIMTATGADEHGEFRMFSIGFFLFEISIYSYL